MIEHPYIKYGKALVMLENSLHNESEIRLEHIVDEITKGLCSYRLVPNGDFEGKNTVVFGYTEKEGKAENFNYLSPHIITTDKESAKVRAAAVKYRTDASASAGDYLSKNDKIGKSEVPVAGEFTSFSKTIGRGAAKSTKLEQGLGLVTTLTQYKPSISNTCLIPDLDVKEMMAFIAVFKQLLFVATDSLFVGKVVAEEAKGNVKYRPKRPKICGGNFPNAPYSSVMGSVALLGSIGELGKEEEYSEKVRNVLDSLRERPIYIIRYGDAKSFTFNNCIIELAKNSKLSSVVDSIYYTRLYNQEERNWGNKEYEKFDLFSSRFLQLFNRPAFKDFLSFRAEYPSQTDILFTTYFDKMENIDRTIIESAKSLGQWLNWVAYNSAKGNTDAYLSLHQKKAKTLVELESSIFAAKTADALIAQTITRAGRLSGRDAPSEAEPFVVATLAGEISLNVAKNLLIAFSRIKSYRGEDVDKFEVESSGDSPKEDYSQL